MQMRCDNDLGDRGKDEAGPHRQGISNERDDELEEMCAIYGDDFLQLTALYQVDSPRRIALIRAAAASEDHMQVAQVAHAFSGSCASIGATRLSALCKELEILARACNMADAEKNIEAIEAEYRRVSAKLDALT